MRYNLALLIAMILTLAVLFSRPIAETWGATPTEGGAVEPISMEAKLHQSGSDLLLDIRLTSNLERPVQVSRSFLPWGAWWSMVLIGVEDGLDGRVLDKKPYPIHDPSLTEVTIEPGVPITGAISLNERFDGLPEALDHSDVLIFWNYRLPRYLDDVPSARAGGWVLIPKRRQNGEASAEVEKALNSTRHIAIQDEHLARILESLSWDMSVTIVVDYRVVQPPGISFPGAPEAEAVLDEATTEELGYVTDGMVPIPNIPFEDVALRDILNALCRPLKLSSVPCPEYVWISTEEMIAKTDFTDPPDAGDAEIAKRLTSQIDIEFKDAHITEILEFVGEYTNVNIVVDKNAVPPPPAPLPGDLIERLYSLQGSFGRPITAEELQAIKAQGHKTLGKDGYQLTGQVPYIRLEDVSLKESLKALLLPLNLTYKVEPGRIYVTSPKNLP